MSQEPATTPAPAAAPLAIAPDSPASPKAKFQALVDSDRFRAQLAAALPKHLTPALFIRVVFTATLKNPKLFECTQESLFSCLFSCAAIGLEPDGRRAALVPLRNRKKQGQPLEANLWLMYQGIAELVMNSGKVSNIHADLVCENDEFEYDRGELKKHKVDYRKDRGEPYAVYCIIRMRDGSEKVEVMSNAEVERIRRASPGADADAWRDHPGEMAKKTVFKRAAKWVPLSAEVREALTNDGPDEPLNVTPKPSLAGILAPPEPKPEPAAPPAIEAATSEPEAPDAARLAELAAAGQRAMAATIAAGKVFTPEERAKVLAAVENGLLQFQIGEVRALKWATENKLRAEGQDEIGTLTTEALLALLEAIPGLAAKKAGAK